MQMLGAGWFLNFRIAPKSRLSKEIAIKVNVIFRIEAKLILQIALR